MDKPTIIRELEIQYNIPIRRKSEKEIFEDSNIESIQESGRPVYCCDESNNITGLFLFNEEIEDISFLNELENIQVLSLHMNKIKDISVLKKLKKIRILDLSNNEISDCQSLIYLPHLQMLNIETNKIKDLSFLKEISKSLRTLYIGHNSPKEFNALAQLTQINNLHIRFTHHEYNYSFLSQLKKLKLLDLEKNKIKEISFIEALKNIESLNLKGNLIKKFPFSIIKNKQLKELYLKGNNISNIPQEIFDRDRNVLEDVRNYWEDLQLGKTKNREVKVILIGNGSVGKTQIAKRIYERDKFEFDSQHLSTHGIVLLSREISRLTVNIWDFAGQDIYHSTHRLFMQTRALFLLVWDLINENSLFHTYDGYEYKNEKLTYWLEYALNFGQGSPILVIQNKVDDAKARRKKILQKTENFYLSHYPVEEFLQVSAKTGYNFDILEYWIEEVFFKNKELMEEVLKDIPLSWVRLKEKVLTLWKVEGLKTISLDDFEFMCRKENILKSYKTLLQYFHNTNVFYYKEYYFKNQIIIDQQWAIDAVYAILNRDSFYFRTGQIKKGKISYKDIIAIWKNNTDAERELFIDFMLSADLCFEVITNKTLFHQREFVAPQLLPDKKPEEIIFWEKEFFENLYINYITYRFLPGIFIQRFIVKAYHFATIENLWQSGVMIKWKGILAIIEADYSSIPKKMVIKLNKDSEELIKKIKKELELISGNKNIVKAQRFESKEDPISLNEKFLLDLIGLNKNQQNRISKAKSIKKSISKNQLSIAFTLTEEIINNENLDEYVKDIILLKSHYNRIKREKNQGVISTENYNIQYNKISKSLIDLLENIIALT